MTAPQQPPPMRPEGTASFAYFLVRVSLGASQEVHGVVERLGSAEKRHFQDGGELARVVTEWVG